jgi:hypothetical protein
MDSQNLPVTNQAGMPAAAQHLQSLGRGSDKVLVHMTPGEVQGLQYLAMRHGGSLTINPKTGLVEAGFLSSILPMVAGAALAATGVGAPMAALMVGGGMTLATGSLKKGLMAGLGAFGGAGLAGGLTAAGATAPAATGTQAGLSAVGETAAADIASKADLLGIAPGVGPGIAAPPAAGMVPGMSATNAAQYFGAGAPGAETFAGIVPPPSAPVTAASVASEATKLGIAPGTGGMYAPPPAPPTFGQNLQQMGRGVTNIFDFQNPAGTEARKAFLGTAADTKTKTEATGVGGLSGLMKYGGAAAAPILASAAEAPSSGGVSPTYLRPFKYNANRQDVTYRTGAPGESTSEQLYFAPRFTPVGVFRPGEEPAYGTYADGGFIARGDEEPVERLMGGGLTALASGGKPSKPRFLMGDGDGMSDSIPATINDVQPARLADGEFVIPADVVSHLGNGSSKAGATKLHSMMKRIRQARTGKKRQAPEVKAERYMPA